MVLPKLICRFNVISIGEFVFVLEIGKLLLKLIRKGKGPLNTQDT